MSKVFVVVNCDVCIFGVFTDKEKAEFLINRLNVDYGDERFFIEERELNTIKSWLVHSKLEEIGIKIIPDDGY